MSDERIEELVAELSSLQPEIRSEPAAYKRAVLRMGIERGIIEAVKVLSPTNSGEGE